MNEWIAVGISGFALAVSAGTAWLTVFRTGKLRMTQPTVFFFGPDGGREDSEQPLPKVFLRTLLYSTARRGQTVESLYINVQRGESRQNFSIWVYGDDRLARGSGLYVGFEGVSCNHHFLLPKNSSIFEWLDGQYTVKVFAKVVSDRKPRLLRKISMSITESQAKELRQDNAGIYFDWGPDQQAYQANIEIRNPEPLPSWLHAAAH